MTGRFGVWWEMDGGGWMHCPISGERIRGTRVQMRQYAKDMTILGWHARPKGKAATGFSARRLDRDANGGVG